MGREFKVKGQQGMGQIRVNMGVHMRSRIFVVSMVSVLLAAPLGAQQSAGPSRGSQSATQTVSDREPLQAPAANGFWDGDDPNVVNLVAHPFANKAYVRRQTAPIHDRLNELDELTSENSRQIHDVDARATREIQMASEKSSLADQHATDAINRAQLAKTAATEASTRVSAAEQTVGSLDQYKGTGAQTEIRFRAGQSVLSKNAKDALDTMVSPLKSQKGYIIEIQGLAPGKGRVATSNAKKMSDSVVRYLVLTHKIPMYRISVLNMGTGQRAKSRRASAGRVEVSVLQNAVVNTAQR
jgi:outer membrane protein OmpA-like peptidoglycan-associated protein